VPFTPVPGPRLLTPPGEDADTRRLLLAQGAVQLAQKHGLSSVHATFLTEAEQAELQGLGYLTRTGKQFHWTNAGYDDFEAFLAALASRKRKAVRKERAEAVSAGIAIEWIAGKDITEAHWDAFFEFYMDTGSRKWGQPYLNRRFFSLLGEAIPDRCLLIMAKRAGRYIAGALNLVGGDCLYGRYWGAIEQHPCLHFEVCYYQAIDWAIAHRLARVEAGAQGEHKLARGYMPTTTYSAHWIADRGFRRADDGPHEQSADLGAAGVRLFGRPSVIAASWRVAARERRGLSPVRACAVSRPGDLSARCADGPSIRLRRGARPAPSRRRRSRGAPGGRCRGAPPSNFDA